MDHIGEYVALDFLGLGGIDARQIVWFAAGGPDLQPLSPGIELLRRIAGLDIVIALLQPRVDEFARDVCYRRISTMFGEHNRRCEFSQQRNERWHAKAIVTHLDHMAQLA